MRERSNKMEIITFCVSLILIYMSIIFIVQLYNRVSTIEARKIVNKYIRNCIFVKYNEKFNIYLGIDANGCASSKIIENDFKELSKIYQSYYFYDYTIKDNFVVYGFKVSSLINDMSEEQLFEYCLALCESMVHKAIHKVNPSFGHIDGLISIRINNDMLLVYLAEDMDAARINKQQIEKLRRMLRKKENSADIEEEWEETK